ncbi:hypothetical protein [Sanguibacteroides justesenii]|uniref:Carboxypeptidase regulatory-like domain-containing protein n=1 Tax=Sanguibacteroides justesenii TaxID=1547597 RepID=A0AB34R7T9_9PORP|nr:hypothetical protein [Sanguibacteroides justesenii]KIO46380.1 hypothetical protein IE90_04395 [Sanguibacteroides justesenii]
MRLIAIVIFILMSVLGMNMESKAAVVEGFTVKIKVIDPYGEPLKYELVTFATQTKPDLETRTALVMTDENGIARGYFPVSLAPCKIVCFVCIKIYGENYVGVVTIVLDDIAEVPKLIVETIRLTRPPSAILITGKMKSMGIAVLEDKRKVEFI